LRRFDPGQLEGAAAKLWPEAERNRKKQLKALNADSTRAVSFMLAGLAFKDFQVEKDKHWKTHGSTAN
jgi:hypothetical protein